MADVFLSYARADANRAELIKRKLEELGLTVFFDTEGLDSGDVFPDVLDREVKSAKAVVGVWSRHALTRPWVKIECDIGRARGVLVPVQIENIPDLDRPAAFWNIQFDDLSSFNGDTSHQGWTNFVRSLERVLRRGGIRPTTEPSVSESPNIDQLDFTNVGTSPMETTSTASPSQNLFQVNGVDYSHISQLIFHWEGQRFIAAPSSTLIGTSGSQIAKNNRNAQRIAVIELAKSLRLNQHYFRPGLADVIEALRQNPANAELMSTNPSRFNIYNLPNGSFDAEKLPQTAAEQFFNYVIEFIGGAIVLIIIAAFIASI